MKTYEQKYKPPLLHDTRELFRLTHGSKAILWLLCFFIFSSFQPDNETDKEYKLKAVFIYNFTMYVEWDPSAMSQEFVIGIIGSSSIDGPLEEIARAKTCNGKKIVIRHISPKGDIPACNILFIPRDADVSLSIVLPKVPKGTLTISEKNGYAANGTAINFVIVDNKLKFEANPKAISSAGLKASSQLLKLAIIVD